MSYTRANKRERERGRAASARRAMALARELAATRATFDDVVVARDGAALVLTRATRGADARDDAFVAFDVVVTVAAPDAWPATAIDVALARARGLEPHDARAIVDDVRAALDAFDGEDGRLVLALAAARDGARARNAGDGGACACCLERVRRDAPDVARVDACLHAFHGACWRAWTRARDGAGVRCPTCRAATTEADAARFARAAAAADARDGDDDGDDDGRGTGVMVVDAATRAAVARARAVMATARDAQRARGGEIDATTAGRGARIEPGMRAPTRDARARVERETVARADGARGEGRRRDGAWLARARARTG